MANRIISLGPVSQASENTSDVYVDVAMTAAASQTGYRASKLTNIASVQNSLHNIFTWNRGERVLNPEFGSTLRNYLYDGITQFNSDKISAEIHKLVQTWEPRVKISKIVNVSTTADSEHNTLSLDIYYTIPSLSNETFVYSL